MQMTLASGAPLEISEDLLMTFNISIVARGSVSETGHSADDGSRYRVPHEREIFRSVAKATPFLALDPKHMFCGRLVTAAFWQGSRAQQYAPGAPGFKTVCAELCRQLDSPSEMTTATVVKRILANRQVRRFCSVEHESPLRQQQLSSAPHLGTPT
jgi:hypothetical protein